MSAGPLTTHVLDTARGKPAAHLEIELHRMSGPGIWNFISSGKTNADGRLPGLLADGALIPGIYKLKFDTAGYFHSIGTQGFYPFVEVAFEIQDSSQHYHVPLLLNPYGYSTYRGS